MSTPGSATRMVSQVCKNPVIHLSDDKNGIVTPPRLFQAHAIEGLHEPVTPNVKPSPVALITTPMVGELKTSLQVTSLPATEKQIVKSSNMMPSNIDGAFFSASTQNESKCPAMPNEGAVCAWTPTEPVLSLTFAQTSQSVLSPGAQHELTEPVMPNQDGKAGAPDAQASPGLNKENISVRSYQRDRKRGRLVASQGAGLEKQQKVQNSSQTNDKGDSQPSGTQHNRVLMDLLNSNFVKQQPTKPQVAEEPANLDGDMQQDLVCAANSNQQCCPSIRFMNMVDDNRRMQLTKLVEKLGGRVTNNGNKCTHVVTGEARRTINFCNALNAGYLFYFFDFHPSAHL